MTYKELLQQLRQLTEDQMTYKQLLQQLQQLTEDQLNKDVCIYNSLEDQLIQLDATLAFLDPECEVLNLDHSVIRF